MLVLRFAIYEHDNLLPSLWRKDAKERWFVKPELIFINEHDGKITMTKEELIALVDKAYEAGQRNGNITYTTNPTWEYAQWTSTT